MRDLNALPLPELFSELVSEADLWNLLQAALNEDADASGDITTASIVDSERTAKAELTARAAGVIAGATMVSWWGIVSGAGNELCFRPRAEDGAPCAAGQALGRFSGSLACLLTLERPMLNLLGHLSGIATLTRRFVDAIQGTRAVICDTRKTTPGLRGLEKYAVRCGGGTLHRIGLSDALLYKDNHIAGIAPEQLAGRLSEAITRVRGERDLRFVEVEVDTLAQLAIILGLQEGLVDMVLLDNMPIDRLREAVSMRNAEAPRVLLEVSGGVQLDTVRAVADSGVDRISVGALTHSSPWLDVGLDVQ